MFESLSDRLTGALTGLRGKGRLTDADIDATAREIRLALLEADVSLPVVRQFVAHIKDRAKGAEVLAGGEWDGNCCSATVLRGVTSEMTVFEEETFGPVTSLYPFDSLEEALELANNTEYGLSASIFTRDLDKALAFDQRA